MGEPFEVGSPGADGFGAERKTHLVSLVEGEPNFRGCDAASFATFAIQSERREQLALDERKAMSRGVN